jgi:hypothetical protein
LLRVNFSGIEYLGTGRPVSPLSIKVGIGAEVNEHAKFEILPFELLGGRFYVSKILGLSKLEAKRQVDKKGRNPGIANGMDQSETSSRSATLTNIDAHYPTRRKVKVPESRQSCFDLALAGVGLANEDV